MGPEVPCSIYGTIYAPDQVQSIFTHAHVGFGLLAPAGKNDSSNRTSSSVGHLYLEERLLCRVLSSKNVVSTNLLSSPRNMATTGSKPPPQESLPYTLSLSPPLSGLLIYALGHGSSQKATKAGQIRLAELKEWKKAREEAKKIEAMAPKKPRFLVRHLASKAATVPGKSLLLSSSCKFFILLWTLIWPSMHAQSQHYQNMSG